MRFLSEYLRRRRAERELFSMSERELSDIGIKRCDIPRIVRESA